MDEQKTGEQGKKWTDWQREAGEGGMWPSTNTGGSGLQFVWVCNLEFKAPTQDPCVWFKLTIKIKLLVRMIKLGHNLSFPETPKIPQQMRLTFYCQVVEKSVTV